LTTGIILDNLLEILLGIVFTTQLGAIKFLWENVKENRKTSSKNSESIDMILTRIFGLEKDPTDEGHIVETEKRFDGINDKLDEISERQKQMERERKQEHEKVTTALNSVIGKLSEDESIDFEREKLK
jgi:hypothetical protein